jgi:hypothetical protein
MNCILQEANGGKKVHAVKNNLRGGTRRMNNEEQKAKYREKQNAYDQLRYGFRTRNGMNGKTGSVERWISVFWDHISQEKIHNHPFFHGIPEASIRPYSKDQQRIGLYLELLQAIENRVKDLMSGRVLESHPDGADAEGVNLARRVVDGGTHAENGFSGSIQCADLMKEHPTLTQRAF